MLSPIIEEVAAEVSDVKIGKINVDEEPQLAAQFGDRKSTRLNSSHITRSRMPSSA